MPDGALASSAPTRQLTWPQWGERHFDPTFLVASRRGWGYQPGLDGLRAV